jgi:hypothetical protein
VQVGAFPQVPCSGLPVAAVTCCNTGPEMDMGVYLSRAVICSAFNAGGGDSELLLPVNHCSIASGSQQLHVGVSGLKGGHSGDGSHHTCRMLTALIHCASIAVQCGRSS